MPRVKLILKVSTCFVNTNRIDWNPTNTTSYWTWVVNVEYGYGCGGKRERDFITLLERGSCSRISSSLLACSLFVIFFATLGPHLSPCFWCYCLFIQPFFPMVWALPQSVWSHEFQYFSYFMQGHAKVCCLLQLEA